MEERSSKNGQKVNDRIFSRTLERLVPRTDLLRYAGIKGKLSTMCMGVQCSIICSGIL